MGSINQGAKAAPFASRCTGSSRVSTSAPKSATSAERDSLVLEGHGLGRDPSQYAVLARRLVHTLVPNNII